MTMENLERHLRLLEIYGQRGMGTANWAPGVWAGTLGAVDMVPEEVVKAGLAREEDALIPIHRDSFDWLISNGLDAGVQEARDIMVDVLSPAVFWCRFCRVTLEPQPSGKPIFRAAPLPTRGMSWVGYLDALATYRIGWLS